MSKKILITGAAGFIGSFLTELCVKKGYKVVAFDRYNPNNHIGWLENSKYINDIEVLLGDIRDFDSVLNAIDGCDSVFHLAALIGIPYSYISPLAYLKTNIEGTYNVLEASKLKNINQILITSTSETYGNAKYIPIDEDHPLIAQSPYSSSKIAADQLALSYYFSFNMPIKIVRPFNTYGPRQSLRAIIPTIITQLLAKNEKIKLGNLNPTRDLTYVEDTVDAFLKIYEKDELFGEIINIGSNKEISVREIFNQISSILGVKALVEEEDLRIRPKKSEVNRLVCNNEKIYKSTGWQPRTSLQEGLNKTINWFKSTNNSYNSTKYNV